MTTHRQYAEMKVPELMQKLTDEECYLLVRILHNVVDEKDIVDTESLLKGMPDSAIGSIAYAAKAMMQTLLLGGMPLNVSQRTEPPGSEHNTDV